MTARAGNVIGGGDWSPDRLIPDFVRAAMAERPVTIRYPGATRPWQHVLEPLAGYLLYAERLYAGVHLPPALNFGPVGDSSRTVGWVVEQLMARWGSPTAWKQDNIEPAPEARTLTVDATLATQSLGWFPRLDPETALDWTVAWYRAHAGGQEMRAYSLAEIQRYQELSQ